MRRSVVQAEETFRGPAFAKTLRARDCVSGAGASDGFLEARHAGDAEAWLRSFDLVELEANGFESAFAVEVDPEFPPPGDGAFFVYAADYGGGWGFEVVGCGRHHGHALRDFVSRRGAPLVVRIEPEDRPAWVAMFAASGSGSVRGVFATPAPTSLAVVVDGLAYSVDTARPQTDVASVFDGVETVAACSDPPLLFLATSLSVVALGPSGVAWRTPRLCLDGLQLRHADHEGIICWCEYVGATTGSREIVLDPASGAQVAGARWRGPPETGWPSWQLNPN